MSFDIPDFSNPATDSQSSGAYGPTPIAARKPVVRVPAPSAPPPPAPQKSEPVATPAPATDVAPVNGARMIFLRYAPGQGWYARFLGFNTVAGNGNELPMRGETFEEVCAYLRSRNGKVFDSAWLMVAPR